MHMKQKRTATESLADLFSLSAPLAQIDEQVVFLMSPWDFEVSWMTLEGSDQCNQDGKCDKGYSKYKYT